MATAELAVLDFASSRLLVGSRQGAPCRSDSLRGVNPARVRAVWKRILVFRIGCRAPWQLGVPHLGCSVLFVRATLGCRSFTPRRWPVGWIGAR